jgi:hypothetical protein
MKTNIIVNLQYAALHCWPEAKNYLKHPHRHVFYITCKKEVKHDNRDIEFIFLKEQIEDYLTLFNHDFGSRSCEMLAKLLIRNYNLNYCKVMEENENGAEVYSE